MVEICFANLKKKSSWEESLGPLAFAFQHDSNLYLLIII